jgi:D-alanyl-D-alanine carboxypeptidase (penicillin-binding protein 5/6)
MSLRRPRHVALRGLFTRVLSILLGVAIGGVIIVAMQVPLQGSAAVATITSASVVPAGTTTPLAWPAVGSAALVIPSFGVARSWNNEVVPIASLTKMMTTYVTLQKFPLTLGETGPCLSVNPGEVLAYEAMKQSGQSVAAVASGESLCEIDLLNGLLVHSADNYASLLAQMVAGGTKGFVPLMNQAAASLGLANTHYADVSGFDSGSVSTALDQAHLAVLIMRSPLVRSIVAQTSVTLPVAGTLGTFTPLLGTNDVIGVKSGRTTEAGGCDVMAMTFRQGSTTQVLYAVVLGQRGGDLLGPAGEAALALASSALANERQHLFSSTTVVGTLGWGTDVVKFTLARSHLVSWWSTRASVAMSVRVRRFTGEVRRGEFVGWLVVHGTRNYRFALRAQGAGSPPSLWQRLR